MALPATNIIEVQSTGSDSSNGGGFDPANANFATDLAATSATGASPVVTSASYNFAAGDVNAWLFVKSGTNWTPGWYKIASVAANAATLSAAAGAAFLMVNSLPASASTAAGCATTASPTGGTWAIDYSQGTSPIAVTGATTSGANAVLLTVSATVALIGNGLVVTGGTNFTTGYYSISNASAGVSLTLDRNCATGVGASGAAGVGGALASPGKAGGLKVAGNSIAVKGGTYTLGSSSANVATGVVSDSTGGVSASNTSFWFGYTTNRFVGNADAQPIVSAGSIATITMFAASANFTSILNLYLDGNSQTAVICFKGSAAGGSYVSRVTAANGTNGTFGTFQVTGGSIVDRCICTGATSAAAAGFLSSGSNTFLACESYANACDGFQSTAGTLTLDSCLSYANTNSGRGFRMTGGEIIARHCVSYGNAGNNWGLYTLAKCSTLINCVAEGSTGGFGFGLSAVSTAYTFINCASYNNASGDNLANAVFHPGFISNTTGTFFTNAAGNDFSLNNLPNQGALLRAAGYPGTWPRGTTIGYRDVGAAQHKDPFGAYLPQARGMTGGFGE